MPEMTVEQAIDTAFEHHQAGRLQEAEHIYRQVLAHEPHQPEALHLLGVMACHYGQYGTAVSLIRQALAILPNEAAYHANLGIALCDMGQLDAALDECQTAIRLNPGQASSYLYMGKTLRLKDRLAEAMAAYRQAIALKPDYPEAHNNLGNTFQDNGQLEEAIASYRRALALRPEYPEAHNNLGNALKHKGQIDEAIACYQRALSLRPNFAEVYNNLAEAWTQQGRLDNAIACCQRALSINPQLAAAHSNMGITLKEMGQVDEAMVCFQKAIALQFEYPEAHNNFAGAWKDRGQLDEAVASYRQAMALRPGFMEAHDNVLLTLHYHPGYDASAIYEEHRQWNRQHAEPLKKFIQPHTNSRNPERRLKIGYISADLREHPVGRFLLPLLRCHDKKAFEVHCYAQVPQPDALTERLRVHADAWRSLVGLSDEQVSDLIRQDEIDILVDLALHTGGNRLLVFARKPAPVQVTYLAYCSTSGMDTMDYRLTDPYMDPPETDDRFYSERSIRLPDTYWCYEPSGPTPDVGPLPSLSNGRITFGCLNNPCKMTPPTVTAWAQVLRTVPHSELLLCAHLGSHRQNLQQRFEAAGIGPERLRFVGKVPMREYLELYQGIDIGLDPFPFGGGTTTCDALWMGVPVVSLIGRTAVGRGGLSLLSNVGLEALAGHSEEQYVKIAVELAQDRERLRELRATLRQRMQSSPLMDGPTFAHGVEEAYRGMWREWCAGKAG